MDRFFEQLKELARGYTLRSERKAEIRQNLAAYMNANAVVFARSRTVRAWRIAFASLLLFAILGASSTYASERSLPGDALYGMKLWTEELKANLTSNTDAKAQWEAERAERRLDEAASLAAEGRLTTELQTELEGLFAEHAARVGDRIEMFESKDNFKAAAGIASRFEASLDAHNRILTRLETVSEEPEKNVEVAKFKEQVKTRLESVKNVRVEAEERARIDTAQTTTTEAVARVRTEVEGSIQAAENVLSQAESYMDDESEKDSPEDNTRIEVASKLIDDAKAKWKAGELDAAFRTAGEAARAAQEAKVLLRAEKNLKMKFDKHEDGDEKVETKTEDPGRKNESRGRN